MRNVFGHKTFVPDISLAMAIVSSGNGTLKSAIQIFTEELPKTYLIGVKPGPDSDSLSF
jgi:hypothetical protein